MRRADRSKAKPRRYALPPIELGTVTKWTRNEAGHLIVGEKSVIYHDEDSRRKKAHFDPSTHVPSSSTVEVGDPDGHAQIMACDPPSPMDLCEPPLHETQLAVESAGYTSDDFEEYPIKTTDVSRRALLYDTNPEHLVKVYDPVGDLLDYILDVR